MLQPSDLKVSGHKLQSVVQSSVLFPPSSLAQRQLLLPQQLLVAQSLPHKQRPGGKGYEKWSKKTELEAGKGRKGQIGWERIWDALNKGVRLWREGMQTWDWLIASLVFFLSSFCFFSNVLLPLLCTCKPQAADGWSINSNKTGNTDIMHGNHSSIFVQNMQIESGLCWWEGSEQEKAAALFPLYLFLSSVQCYLWRVLSVATPLSPPCSPLPCKGMMYSAAGPLMTKANPLHLAGGTLNPNLKPPNHSIYWSVWRPSSSAS